MNKGLIAILGIIVVAVSFYFLNFQQSANGEKSVLIEKLESEDNQKVEVIENTNNESMNDALPVEENDLSLLSDSGPTTIVAYQEGQETAVKSMIAKQHEYLNQLAGWGNTEELDLHELKEDEEWQQLQDDIAWLQENGFSESVVLTDMKNAQEFLTVTTTGDSMSLRYLHRIFHDLDANLNDQEVDKVWDVTHAFGTEAQQEQLLAYLTSD